MGIEVDRKSCVEKERRQHLNCQKLSRGILIMKQESKFAYKR